MGITAENVAERYKISRANQDAFALESIGGGMGIAVVLRNGEAS